MVVEVRSRTSSRFGLPEESVDRGKVARLYRAATMLRRQGILPDGRRLPSAPWRVDLIAVDVMPSIGAGAGGLVVRHHRALEP